MMKTLLSVGLLLKIGKPNVLPSSPGLVITCCTEQYCHLVFCFNFPSQTDVDDVYKCLEDQLLVIIRLSFLKVHQTQQTSYTLQI